ncbi:ethanolamine ammonia-lyase reactivating factor EutA [Pseudonocardia thermophila]|uniref:ethanolamine ammonia-lyase reactivating factor EutA n=1 Tax=Pseudonocardia thermophila TaxID=1848 RepID=UPI00248F0B43|nr:ethanolamine ammonia-lyase reactivating factor EutA [Pseudonocardia thermophila]
MNGHHQGHGHQGHGHHGHRHHGHGHRGHHHLDHDPGHIGDDHHHEPLGPIKDNPIWQQDNVTLTCVGMDIGSSGTQVLFSRLHLRRIGEELSSRYAVVRRETAYRSPVALTPYAGELIDAEVLGGIIDAAYAEAGVDPADVDTGVVILTGEALRRRNAEAIAEVLADRGGALVTAAAGHHMEAMLAAYGSGAAQRSYADSSRILLLDVGGGTTKLAVLDRGRVTATAAVHAGGRLQVVDDTGRIVRLDPAGRAHAARAGHHWEIGDRVSPAELEEVAEAMADVVVAAVTGGAAADPFLLTEPLGEPGRIDGVVFSGGVGEYLYDRERARFGDLGEPLGRALRQRVVSGVLLGPLLPAGECIRATALGASEHSVQLSGNTCWISDPDALLPRRNLQVLHPDCELGETVDAAAIAAAVRKHLARLGTDGADVALAMSWSGPPRYDRVLALARGVRDGLVDRIAQGRPVYVVLDGDVAMTLGRLLCEELGVATDVLVLDGLALRDFDYVDLGRVRQPSNTVPVTIKSLLF